MNKYIWELPQWDHFSWNEAELLPLVSTARLKQGQLIQKIKALATEELDRAEAKIFEEETLKTAQIEGETYNPQSVRSSIYRRLGLDYAGLPHTERHVDGLVEILFDATLHYDLPLTHKRLFGWHAALFPTGYSGLAEIKAGSYRTDSTGPMQVISGPIGKEKVHYQAPQAHLVPEEMEQFLEWWKTSKYSMEGIIRAGVAHFYFVTIHPFADGNGRIARAIADMALAQDDKLAKRYYSLSAAILSQRKAYYEVLEQSQKGTQDITSWLVWFLQCFITALDTSERLLRNIFQKSTFWDKYRNIEINAKQRKVLNLLLDAGQEGFEGGLTTRKYRGITKVSRATAARDISDLLQKGLIKQNEGQGRNVNYDINW
jgi:Fic family protein